MFAVQDPLLPIPSRKLAPNRKIDPMLLHILESARNGLDVVAYIVGDEQDAGVKGRHLDKARGTFKKEGGEFLIDALCDDGFTITFYFRNMPPKNGLQKVCPQHTPVFYLCLNN